MNRPEPLHIALPTPLSGSLAYIGEESLKAVRLYLDEVNDAGGVDGHPVTLDVMDDKEIRRPPRPAWRRSPTGRLFGVLGHYLSVTSARAGPLTAMAHPGGDAILYADAMTLDNPYYFRVQSRTRFRAAG